MNRRSTHYVSDIATILDDILEAILPELPEEERDIPSGFAQVGHVGEFLSTRFMWIAS